MNYEPPRSSESRTMKMSDIARLAGVSTSTVSRALADHASIPEATRKAIQALADEHGYVINRAAQNLRQSQTKTIAVVASLGHEQQQMISDPFFLRLFGCLSDEIVKRGYDVLLVYDKAPNSDWLDRLIRSQRADGFIIAGQSDQHVALNRAAEHYLPMIVAGSQIPKQKYCSVGSDDFAGGRIATDHLLRSGRRRILFIGPADLPQIDRRLEGYRASLGEYGIKTDPALCLPARFTGHSAYEQTRHAITSGIKFDAVFAASDGIAMSAIRAVEEFGRRCPQDVAVVGFDDSDFALQSRPQLTTIRQDVQRLAATAVELLFQRLSGRQTRSRIIPVELVVRDSAPTS